MTNEPENMTFIYTLDDLLADIQRMPEEYDNLEELACSAVGSMFLFSHEDR